MNDLQLGYEKILLYPNDHILFWKDKENLETYLVCKTSKWKQKEFIDGRFKRDKRSLKKALQR